MAKRPARKKAKSKPSLKRGKQSILERYGGLRGDENAAQRNARFQAIDWLEANFVEASIVFGLENVQRRLCALKGIDFDSYDDPDD